MASFQNEPYLVFQNTLLGLKVCLEAVYNLNLPVFRHCDVQNFDNQVNVVVGPHMKRYRNKWQTTARESQLG